MDDTLRRIVVAGLLGAPLALILGGGVIFGVSSCQSRALVDRCQSAILKYTEDKYGKEIPVMRMDAHLIPDGGKFQTLDGFDAGARIVIEQAEREDIYYLRLEVKPFPGPWQVTEEITATDYSQTISDCYGIQEQIKAAIARVWHRETNAPP